LKNARLLLSHFGSVQAITNAGLPELLAAKGVGEKTAQKIFNICRHPYN
jgi:ERCC4-type nuclease